ncbi:diheme cytochrome c [Quatrionicoccus australiensis]|uniref:diheme cytochrome c n=1 Tax=Quatrionicoccus australiensis TaxID=138118 RepID=UPI001CF8E200|nr:diheme cytochrome c [Quatrionicoccus australiensis]UCV13922.1 diheme cytochrome c [Quatrionicoccus australiensis]
MKRLCLITLVAVALPAFADRLPLPADTPASFRTECGSCHLAYPPALLGAADWRRVMATLDKHFTSDATVDARQKQEISAFLEKHAGKSGTAPSLAGEPPRISKTARFVRKHDEIPTRFWRDPRIKSAANCEACHTHAAAGRFSEHDIAIPELRE